MSVVLKLRASTKLAVLRIMALERNLRKFKEHYVKHCRKNPQGILHDHGFLFEYGAILILESHQGSK